MTAERMWVCLGGPLGGARVEVDGAVELSQRFTLAELGKARLMPSHHGFYQAVETRLDGDRLPARQVLLWVPEEPAPSPREQRVAAALASLAPRDRQVLLLWEAGLTYSAIADQTGAAIGAIALMLSRARMHLLDAFDRMDAGFTEGGSFALESRPAAVSSVA